MIKNRLAAICYLLQLLNLGQFLCQELHVLTSLTVEMVLQVFSGYLLCTANTSKGASNQFIWADETLMLCHGLVLDKIAT